MKIYLTAFVVATILVCSRTSPAQDENPAQEHLKPMEALIGTWERDADTGPFIGHFRVTYDWVLRDRFIREVGQFQPEGETELYDLQSDPAEARNLASLQPDRVRAMRGRLDAQASEVGREAPAPAVPYDASAEEKRQLEVLGYVEEAEEE